MMNMAGVTDTEVQNNGISMIGDSVSAKWFGDKGALSFDTAGIKSVLSKVGQQCFIVRDANGTIGVASKLGTDDPSRLSSMELLATVPAFLPGQLGDPAFKKAYGLEYNYMTGAMANGIGSARLVIAMAQAGMLGSFGAAGMVLKRVEEGIDTIQKAVGDKPFSVNLIHSPNEEALERNAVELFLKKGVTIVETSAFMDLSAHVVRYRASGLTKDADGKVHIKNRIIAKLSRTELAEKFMQPAPGALLDQLVAEGKLTVDEAACALKIPMADDITVEADSGGHTDRRSLVCLLPAIIALRNELQATHQFSEEVRVGAAGGLGTPESLFAAFMIGAAYVVTGSINQSCIESGSSDPVRKVLAEADMVDVMMTPAADMFELGVKLQVLKKGSLFGMRAQKLYDLYEEYEGLEQIPKDEIAKLEKTMFRDSLDNIWKGCVDFFNERDPDQIKRAQDNPKRKMALVFRWYLGLSSAWANAGEKGRELDYQIWCGPSMGAFNNWAKGTSLEKWQNRKVADVASHLLTGTAHLFRIQSLEMSGIRMRSDYKHYSVI
ncbi:MAG TPA: PfaD family polyunsaturated fatty acid/polyketide biosynthesis protein [Flavobacteriales bacterium]|nr:PfaD family polyunsaturated fatty acid/polyketide biosynthesis protein [Flavobacteriales bacterium]